MTESVTVTIILTWELVEGQPSLDWYIQNLSKTQGMTILSTSYSKEGEDIRP